MNCGAASRPGDTVSPKTASCPPRRSAWLEPKWGVKGGTTVGAGFGSLPFDKRTSEMPSKPPRVCGCGKRVPFGKRCPCQAKRDAERKARHNRFRPSSSARGYTGSWDRAKAEFLRQHPFCRRCGERAAVVDHKTPHRGNQDLFWDRSNWQPLCTTCHSSAKQREERRIIERN